MKQKAKQLIYLLIAFVALSPGLQAADYSINDFRLGEVVHGDSERMNDLEGKVIVIDFWGVQCGPCIKKMPHLVELDRKYADKGLRIVGAEMQRSRTNRIMSIVKKKNVTFPITRGCANPIRVNRLPHMAIFGVDGKLVYHGYPDSNVDTIILKELEKVVPATEHVITDIR